MNSMDSRLTLGALSTFMEAYAAYCRPICRELGLPRTAFDILMFLSNNPEYCTARDISRLRGLKENIISVNVNKLVTEGYLERRGDSGDRRRVLLQCTEKAAGIIQRGRELQERFFREMQQGLSAQELSIHRHCLETIADNAKRILEHRMQEASGSACPEPDGGAL